MNENIIESEIMKRVAFKLSELKDAITNSINRNKHFRRATWIRNEDRIKYQHYMEAFELFNEIFEKEKSLGTALDGNIKERMWKEKEILVDKISDRLLKHGDIDYYHKKSFINNCLENFVYGKR